MESTASPAPSDTTASKSDTQMLEEDGEQCQRPKKKTKTYTHLTTEQEEAMVDWLKAHEVLYNKKLGGYKDIKGKEFMWQKQAEVMDVSIEELKLRGDAYKKFVKHRWGDPQEVVEGLLIIQAELLHQLMIMPHGYSSLGFQPVPHPT